jgi:2-polyprenyl-3-methyl-5-hydroxy-6-metoxy-1,4-benzoquinol methylase
MVNTTNALPALPALPAIDEKKLNDFMAKAVGDLGAAMHAALVLLGDELGLFKAMADCKPVSAKQLAERTGTRERYVREWLSAQAASGYCVYDAAADAFSLTPEQSLALAQEDGPAFLPGAFQVAASVMRDEPKVRDAFKSGQGVGWHEHDCLLFHGTERFFRPGYNAHLVSSWLPALDGVVPKLLRGADVADVGCGHGASTILMAKTYAKSRFTGYDYHPESIERARAVALREGLGDRVRFEIARAKDYPGRDYDLVTFFDCLHDMGDPVGAAKHVRQSLRADGTWMIVEPFAHDHLVENLNPVGRLMYSASTMICTPASLAQEVGLGLGAQAGEARLRGVVTGGGFKHFRRACETPFNLVLEARP